MMLKMRRMSRGLLAGLALSLFYGFPTRTNSGAGRVEIRIEPQISGQALVLGNQLYHTASGDSLYLDVFRFYISALHLQGNGIDYQETDSCHLVDAEESGSQTIVLKDVSAGRYETLTFYVGTDSLTNVSGAMGGDLDPTKGMYWAWNSGYINIKIEGRSNSCKTLHHAFEFHIGGYMPPNQTVRKIGLPLKNLTIRENATTSVRIKADLDPFFSQIQLTQTNSVMIPSKQAALLADCFKGVFSIK